MVVVNRNCIVDCFNSIWIFSLCIICVVSRDSNGYTFITLMRYSKILIVSGHGMLEKNMEVNKWKRELGGQGWKESSSLKLAKMSLTYAAKDQTPPEIGSLPLGGKVTFNQWIRFVFNDPYNIVFPFEWLLFVRRLRRKTWIVNSKWTKSIFFYHTYDATTRWSMMTPAVCDVLVCWCVAVIERCYRPTHIPITGCWLLTAIAFRRCKTDWRGGILPHQSTYYPPTITIL